MEEKKLTDEEIIKALDFCYSSPCCGSGCPYFNKHGRNFCVEDKALYKDMKRIVLEHAEQKAEIERLKIDIKNEKNWGKIQTKQAGQSTAKEILDKCIAIDKSTGGKGFVCIEAIAELAKGKGAEVE